MSYHSFISLETNEPCGSFCVEFIACDPYLEPGWYWLACWPSRAQGGALGCMPDGDPQGPFESYEQAVKDARLEQ